jgi:HSP20 family molecular chaperone IbpA
LSATISDFTLSNKIDRDRISADLTNGVLTIVLPKAEGLEARTIKIN